MVTLLSYILLFSNDFSDSTLERNEITNCQETMIRMLQRYIFGKYPQNLAINLFAKVLNCVSDLQELCTIKKQFNTFANRLIARFLGYSPKI